MENFELNDLEQTVTPAGTGAMKFIVPLIVGIIVCA